LSIPLTGAYFQRAARHLHTLVTLPRMPHAIRRIALLTGGAFVVAACPASKERAPSDSIARDTLAAAAQAAKAERDTIAPPQALAAADTSTIARGTDTSVTNARPAVLRIASLDPLADSMSDKMTFLAITQSTFLAASRGKRLLIDLGRFDGTLTGPKQRRAFDTAAKVLSPVRIGETFELRGPWGQDSATVTGYALWNGRIVATLAVEPLVDSLAKSGATLVALATRYVKPLVTDTAALRAESIKVAAAKAESAKAAAAAPPPPPKPVDTIARDTGLAKADSTAKRAGCDRDSVDELLALRVAELEDSLAVVLQADTLKLTDRLKKSVKTQRSQAVGCFGPWRVLVFVNQSAGDYEYVHQIALMVDTAGIATPITVRDLRFKAHEAIRAFDVDGDGVDDIAVRGRGNRIGGTVILHFDPKKKRLEYVIGGFAWEEM